MINTNEGLFSRYLSKSFKSSLKRILILSINEINIAYEITYELTRYIYERDEALSSLKP